MACCCKQKIIRNNKPPLRDLSHASHIQAPCAEWQRCLKLLLHPPPPPPLPSPENRKKKQQQQNMIGPWALIGIPPLSAYKGTKGQKAEQTFKENTQNIPLQHRKFLNLSYPQIMSLNFGEAFLHNRAVSLIFPHKSPINPLNDHE